MLIIITGGLNMLRKMLQILFQCAKFVYQSRQQTDRVVKWGGQSGQQHVRINLPVFFSQFTENNQR